MYDDQPLHQVQCLIESAIDEVAKEQERIKQQELKKLEELKAKYEQGN